MDPRTQPQLAAAGDRDRAERELAIAQSRARASRRMRQSVRDMVLSMLVVGAVVVLVAQPWRQDASQQPVHLVPWEPVAAAFASSVQFPVLAPRVALPGWQSTSARITPTVDGLTALHIGWLTAASQYAALEQSDTADVRYVHDESAGGAPTGAPYLAAGRSWERLQTADGSTRSLVTTAPVPGHGSATYLATGSASWDELERLVTSLGVLEPAPTPAATAG